MSAGSLPKARLQLAAWVRSRRAELEEEIIARLYGIADPEGADHAYQEGLRSAVSVALDYELEAIERGEERAPPPPPPLLAQARLAASSGVGLDTVLRRYVAGYTLLGDFLVGEAARGELPEGEMLTQLLRGRAALLDRLLAAVSEEYEQEAQSLHRSSEQRRAERVERLLAAEPLDTTGFDYDFDGVHVAAVVIAPDASEVARHLAGRLGCRLLFVRRSAEVAWAWFGASRQLDTNALRGLPDPDRSGNVVMALGEPARGLAGWRLTHRQAAAALPIAVRRRQAMVRYGDVALLAAVGDDELLRTSLHRLYLAPLDAGRDGESARETLRAYFATARNVSSAAARLGVSRRTVASRLKSIEVRIGVTIADALPDIEVALWIDELERGGS